MLTNLRYPHTFIQFSDGSFSKVMPLSSYLRMIMQFYERMYPLKSTVRQ